MLVIRKQQKHALRQQRLNYYVRQTLQRLSEKYPKRFQQYTEETLIDLINYCLMVCREQGYATPRETTQFIEDVVELGSDLDLPREQAVEEVLLTFKTRDLYSKHKAVINTLPT